MYTSIDTFRVTLSLSFVADFRIIDTEDMPTREEALDHFKEKFGIPSARWAAMKDYITVHEIYPVNS